MNNVKLTADIRMLSPTVAAIDIQGDINAAAEQALSDAYARASSGTRAVILNFTRMDYMNSTGIGLLVTLLVRANRQKAGLMACGLSEHYKRIFHLTRLDEAIPIFDDEGAALAAV